MGSLRMQWGSDPPSPGFESWCHIFAGGEALSHFLLPSHKANDNASLRTFLWDTWEVIHWKNVAQY